MNNWSDDRLLLCEIKSQTIIIGYGRGFQHHYLLTQRINFSSQNLMMDKQIRKKVLWTKSWNFLGKSFCNIIFHKYDYILYSQNLFCESCQQKASSILERQIHSYLQNTLFWIKRCYSRADSKIFLFFCLKRESGVKWSREKDGHWLQAIEMCFKERGTSGREREGGKKEADC